MQHSRVGENLKRGHCQETVDAELEAVPESAEAPHMSTCTELLFCPSRNILETDFSGFSFALGASLCVQAEDNLTNSLLKAPDCTVYTFHTAGRGGRGWRASQGGIVGPWRDVCF